MKSRAAAKGRKLLLLAAVCLLPTLLLSPTAEASRSLPATSVSLEPPAPRWDAEAPPAPRLQLFHLEDELLVELLTGVEPEHHQALLEHRRLELLPSAAWASAIQKTASGVSTSDLELNVQKAKPLKPDLRWTVPFYAKARFYDPEVGRFLTEDPAEPDLTTPPSLHKYLYAYGNPTYYVDPDGREGMGLTEQDFEAFEAIEEQREQARAQKVIEALEERKAFHERLGGFLESEDFTLALYRGGALNDFLKSDPYSEKWGWNTGIARMHRLVFGRSDLAPHIIIAGEVSIHAELIEWAGQWFAAEPAMAVGFGMYLEQGLAAREMLRRGKLFEESIENSRRAFPEEIVEFADVPPESRFRSAPSRNSSLTGPTPQEDLATLNIERLDQSTRATFGGMEIRGVRDLSHVDESTLKAMAEHGFAAKDARGNRLVLHHLEQDPAGPIVEIPAPRHSIGNRVQHPLGNAPGSGLSNDQRAAFNTWRVEYWKARAREELARRGLQ